MRFSNLSKLKRRKATEIEIAALPQSVSITRFAMDKAFKINELVRQIHRQSCEWYGFTLASRTGPELIVDIGLPGNDQNVHDYTGICPEKIASFQELLPPDVIVNGWIHSHGALNFQRFSTIDEMNHLTVLDYVTALLRKPVVKKEVIIENISWHLKGELTRADIERENVCIVTDVPVGEVRILETVYGGFSYAIVIGDGGWHRQQILYKHRGILTGHTDVSSREADLALVHSERALEQSDIAAIARQVEENIEPTSRRPWPQLERA